MNLVDAWTTLGFDPDEVLSSIKASRDRAAEAKRLEAEAKTVCKRLLAAHHPDKNPGDAGASKRFRRVQNAMQIISQATSDLAASVRKDPDPRPGKVSIVFGPRDGDD